MEGFGRGRCGGPMGGFQGVVVFADTLAAVDGGVGGGVDGADPVAVVGAEHIGE